MPRPELERLADFIGCGIERLATRAGAIVEPGTRAFHIRFGDLKLERADVDLVRRRVAPTTLRERPFHHDAWLLTLLPYCPVSLERLVDECTACGTKIGWERCWGIGICEGCRMPTAPSAEPPLPKQDAAVYRLFSELISSNRTTRRAAVLRLPPCFHDVEPSVIVTMALHLGQFCRDVPVRNVRRECIRHLDPQLLASVITTGTGLLRDWPLGIQDWARDGFARNVDDLEGHHRVRAKIRRLADPRLEHPTQIRIVRDALPHEFGSITASSASGEFVTATQIKRRTSLKRERLAILRKDLEDRRVPGRLRIRSQFNVDRVRESGDRYRTSIRIRRVTNLMKLPAYAIEQMISLDVIPMETDETVQKARFGMCMQQGSVDRLLSELRSRASSRQLPQDAIAIETAARVIGGREKPWGQILDAFRQGRLEFWLAGEEVTSRTILVRSAALNRFRETEFDASRYVFPFLQTVNSNEAEEILNISPKNTPGLFADGLLSFSGGPAEKSVSKSDVLRLAGQMVSPAELGFALGTHPRGTATLARKMGVRPIGCGWSREDLADLGIVAPPQVVRRSAAAVRSGRGAAMPGDQAIQP